MGELLDGRYEPVELVGRGGQGEVLRALDHQHARQVALKVRPAPPAVDRQLLMAEARVLLDLRPHPSLPLVRDDFFDGDRYVLVMDWVEGTSLAEVLAQRGDPGLAVSAVVGWLSQVAAALDHLHTHEPPIVHGDVKPANVILTPEGRAVLVDFGIARRVGAPPGAGDTRAGSEGYQAPEAEPTPAADVYGLAATAVALLAGAPPSAGRPAWEGIPAEQATAIESTLRRALATDPIRRPATAGELLTRLQARLAAALPTGVVTFMLTDIEGSASLWEKDSDAMSIALERHDQLVADVVDTHRGLLLKTRGEGDSAFAVFASPSDGLSCACALQRELVGEPWPDGAPIRVRIALHTGEAQLRGQDYYGTAVNRAARLRALALGGQILVSEATAALGRAALPAGASLRSAGTHRLRGLDEVEPIFQLTHPSLPDLQPPEPEELTRAGNLPATLTAFVGRTREVAEVSAAVRRSRLVTLTGPGGVGKTRLALETAAGLGDEVGEVWLVDLASVEDGAHAATAVAVTLGARQHDGIGVPDALAAEIGGRPMLVILDNCEHVVDACAELARALLRRCPGLRILATSRERLGVDGEVVWPVAPLETPAAGTDADLQELLAFDAVRLFLDRARAASPGFAGDDADVPLIARICARLDGLPLALELAAARTRTLSLAQLDARLEDQLHLLTGGNRTSDSRHQTIRSTIEWSHGLLGEDERAVLRRLSVFAGGASLAAVEAVCAGPPVAPQDVADVVGQLLDKSLVTLDRSSDEPRYRLLESIRAYAAERLAESGEALATGSRHLAWCHDLALDSAADLAGHRQIEILDRLEVEHDNLRTAMYWAVGEGGEGVRGLELAVALMPFWEVRGYVAEGRRWIDGARVAAHGADPELVVRSLLASGELAQAERDFGAARPAYDGALGLARQLGDRGLEADALYHAGSLAFFAGDAAAARPLLEQSLSLARAAGEERCTMLATLRLGAVNRMRGEYATAIGLFAEGLDLARRAGDLRNVGVALIYLGSIAQATGDNDAARSYLEEALALSRRLGFRQYLAATLGSLGNVATVEDRLDEARAFYEESLEIARRLGDGTNVMMTLFNLANVAELSGEPAEAAEAIYAQSLSEARRLGHKRGVSLNLRALGNLALTGGELGRARELLTESLSLRVEIDDKRGVAECLEEFGRLTLAEGRAEQAAVLLGAGDEVRLSIGDTREPAEQARFDDARAACAATLGPARFTSSLDEGRGLPIEEAIARTSP